MLKRDQNVTDCPRGPQASLNKRMLLSRGSLMIANFARTAMSHDTQCCKDGNASILIPTCDKIGTGNKHLSSTRQTSRLGRKVSSQRLKVLKTGPWNISNRSWGTGSSLASLFPQYWGLTMRTSLLLLTAEPTSASY